MSEIEPATLLLPAAAVLGALFGVIAQRSAFCVVSGVRETVEGRGWRKLQAVAVAALVAIAGTQALAGMGLLDLAGVGYLPASGSMLGVAAGGLLFGLGAIAARGCLGRLTVLSATGNLRALIVVGVAGLVAYAAMRGVLAAPRGLLQGVMPSTASATDLGALAAQAAGVSAETARLALAGLALAGAGALLGLSRDRWHGLAGLAIGLLVVAGWAATGVLLVDEFDPKPAQSLTFAAPLGQSIVYLLTATGARPDFGAALIGGVLAGSFVAAAATGGLRLVAFEGPGQTLRYLGGAVLMGFGAVVALGCTTGQGLTGLSTLAPLSLVAVTAMLAGLRLGLALEGRLAARAGQPALA